VDKYTDDAVCYGGLNDREKYTTSCFFFRIPLDSFFVAILASLIQLSVTLVLETA
jgi:hypothetical protein